MTRRVSDLRLAGFIACSLVTFVSLIGLGLRVSNPVRSREADATPTTKSNTEQLANDLARDALERAKTDPRTGLLMAAAASETMRATHTVGTEPERALRSILGQVRGRSLLADADAETSLPVSHVALSATGDHAAVARGSDVLVWDLAAGQLAPTHLRGHEGPVESLVVSPDGRWLLTATERTLRAWDLHAADPAVDPRIFRARDAGFGELEVSADGAWVAASSYAEGRVSLLRLDEPTTLASIATHRSGPIHDVALAADRSAIYVAGDDGAVWIGQLAPDGAEVTRRVALSGHEGPAYAVAASRDGRWLVSGGHDGTARVWDLSTAAPWRNPVVLAGHEGPVTHVAVTPDSRLAVTASRDRTLRIWELDDPDPAATGVTFRGHTDAITDLLVEKGGEWAVTSGRDGKIIAWNLAKRNRVVEHLQLPGFTRPATDIALSADGRWLVAGSASGAAHVWDYRGAQTSNAGSHVGRAHDGAILDLALDASDARFVTVGVDGDALIWDLAAHGQLTPRRTFDAHQAAVNAVAIAPSGRWVASADQAGRILVWDLVRETLDNVATLEGHEGEVLELAFTSSGDRLVSCSTDGSVRVWTADSWSSRVLDGHRDEVVRLALARDDKYLVSADITGRLLSWDMGDAGDEPIQRLAAHEGEIWALRFDAEGRRVVSGGVDRNARVWQVKEDGRLSELLVLRGHDDTINSTDFSPDGRSLATASRDGSVRLWRLDSAYPQERSKVLDLSEHGGVDIVCFGPRGSRLLASTTDGSVHVWTLDEHTAPVDHQALRGHENKISAMSLSREGDFLVTASYDGTARVWPLSVSWLIEFAYTAAGRAPSSSEWDAWLANTRRPKP